jgi:hypothetical protein
MFFWRSFGTSRDYHRPNPFIGEKFDEYGMGQPPVYDVGLFYPAVNGQSAAIRLGDHSPCKNALFFKVE